MDWFSFLVGLLEIHAAGPIEFPRVPYQPYQSGDPLPDARAPRPDDGLPEPVALAHARRPFEPALAGFSLPVECASARERCTSHALTLGFGWRLWPQFAWTLEVQRTSLPENPVYYAAVGTRVFALDSSAVDPYLGLSLGVEHWNDSPRLGLASELGFGVRWFFAEHASFGPVLRLRQGQTREHSCTSYAVGCRSWSGLGERWLYLGLSLELSLGDPH